MDGSLKSSVAFCSQFQDATLCQSFRSRCDGSIDQFPPVEPLQYFPQRVVREVAEGVFLSLVI